MISVLCSFCNGQKTSLLTTNSFDGDDVGGWATRSDCDTCPGGHLSGRTPLGLMQDRRGRASRQALLTSHCWPTSGPLGLSGRGRQLPWAQLLPVLPLHCQAHAGWLQGRSGLHRRVGRQHPCSLQSVVLHHVFRAPLPGPGPGLAAIETLCEMRAVAICLHSCDISQSRVSPSLICLILLTSL